MMMWKFPARTSCILLVVIFSAHAFSNPKTIQQRKSSQSGTSLYETSNAFFASPVTESKRAQEGGNTVASPQRRKLGSQELLMLPRQYGVKPDVVFPSMNHVHASVLSATPSQENLEKALEAILQAHPLLSSKVEGTGEPDERIDLFKMVRKGEPDPLTFVQTKIEPSKILERVVVSSVEDIEPTWQRIFNEDLDDGSWCDPSTGPLWRAQVIATSDPNAPCALLMSFNHAISDQTSACRLLDQWLKLLVQLEESSKISNPPRPQSIPLSLEEAVLGPRQTWADISKEEHQGVPWLQTISYVAGKAGEDARGPVILPDNSGDEAKASESNGFARALTTISGNVSGGQDKTKRSSVTAFRTLDREATQALLQACRINGVSITNALSAAATYTATDFVGNDKSRVYKVLQSMDMRRFGDQGDKGESFGCHAGSMDLLHGPLADQSGLYLRSQDPQDEVALRGFWDLARQGREQTGEFIVKKGPEDAVRVFDFAMTVADLNNLVHLTAESKDTQGRAYSAGFTNAGVYEGLSGFAMEGDDAKSENLLKTEHGRYKVQDVYYAASNARSGSLYRFSCMSINGELKFTFHPATPIVSDETNEAYADALMDLLQVVSGTKSGVASMEVSIEPSSSRASLLDKIPENSLAFVAAAVGSISLLSHGPAYAQFFQSVMEMKENVADPADFWAALNFWIFFAVGHPILQPILWISDVLHGSPGPKIADLVPYTFLGGNILAIAAFASSKEIQKAVNIAALFAFFSYVGAGLDGTAGLGDFNLALDDPYKGKIVKGCPAYDDVRQPSMNDFDITKYQGLWYEHKFHDWTQFKEVYDTTLNIKLTEDGKGWIDDFAVKGPAPDAAPLSWDKSPVANGAHYFLFGRVDSRDPPGVLRESGFGVEFPNYIVDVQKDPTTGEYKEAIQFQCLERGGVRVFEGINFMSRNPTMSAEELQAMHSRAETAGMFPYGASPEQMHTVARRPNDAPPLQNSWQDMWKAIGVDKLLELLTEAIEDGGR